MGENKGDSQNNATGEFDLKNELSVLVAQNIIPSKIADKLEKKLIEKNVKINKEQLYTLANKINEVFNNYKKSSGTEGKYDITKVAQPIGGVADADMQKLVEKVEELNERINNIEVGTASDAKIVTTEEIQVSEKITVPTQEWKVDPLSVIPSDAESVIILMKWLQFLIDKCGRSNLHEILDYYVDIGWISEDVKISLMDYSNGITEDVGEGNNIKKWISDLPSKDHIQSLIFIQKLKGKQFDKHFIDRVDGEISRILKKLDGYKFKH